jgi:oligosaccharide translocation protein RFT1
MTTNIGSLIARILFQPLEESLRTILSNLLSPPTPASLQQSCTLITTLLKLHILLALIIHTLVPPLITPLVLPILGALIGRGRFPAHALEPILYAYLYYIPIMAINGVTESFIASVATTGDLARQSRAMVVFSVVFLGASWGLLREAGMGGEGLVWANCNNLGVRIVWSWGFMRTWFMTRKINVQWTRVLPNRGTLVSAGVVGVGMRVFSKSLDGWIAAVGLAGVGGLILVGCMYVPPCRD